MFLADAEREASVPTTRAIARSCFYLLHVWALAESCTGGEASAWRPGRCQQEVVSATSEFVKFKAYLKEKDRRTRALECHRTPLLYHQKKGLRKKKKKKGSLQISSSPDRKSPPPVPDLHDPDLPTLARSGQVVCRDPAHPLVALSTNPGIKSRRSALRLKSTERSRACALLCQRSLENFAGQGKEKSIWLFKM